MDKGHPGALRIDRHANSIDPLAAMTDPVAEWEVRQDDPALAEAFEGMSNFDARMCVLQVNKGWYEYFSSMRSDWLILDAGPLRHDLLTFDVEQEDGRRGTAYLEETNENKKSLGKLVEMGALPEPAGRLMPEDMPDEEFDRLMGAFCDRILELYDEGRIILHEFYPAEWYVNGNRINAFSAYSGDTPLKFSRRMARGFAYYRQRFPRAHVIEFPHGVPGDANHPLGKACLHYVQEYYDYALAAVEIIVGGGFSPEEERRRLYELKLESEQTIRETYEPVLGENMQRFWKNTHALGDTKKKLETERQKNARLEGQLKAERQKNARLEAEVKAERQKNTRLEAEVDELRSSTTWKVGRAVTWLPRKLKDAVKG